jgi:hypothetical protein
MSYWHVRAYVSLLYLSWRSMLDFLHVSTARGEWNPFVSLHVAVWPAFKHCGLRNTFNIICVILLHELPFITAP